ncbi:MULTISPECIES: hypothetical protein [Pedobacter]|uniref:Uncharacterized protein n=1 Tax=Pedobacter jeongneungensis TaxID=947309 RepID=A0ABP8B2G8_9SPHI|nr:MULTISPECIES: hypothetical protein [Pedobacter]MCX2575750.1 hypothetical protein [Pedobacter sandarakinus]
MKVKEINPELLALYHGSLGLDGMKINIQSGKGVGWNALTLGNAFYTSISEDAACLFSHLVLQKSRLNGEAGFDNLGYAKIYKITLSKDASILDADKALDASRVRSILLCAGVSERYLNHRHDDQLSDFYKVADLLCYGMNWEGNRNEYLTRVLGYDGLLIKERAWENWDYYPSGIGIDWDKINDPKLWPPKTVAIYNTDRVAGFEVIRDGVIDSLAIDHSDLQR